MKKKPEMDSERSMVANVVAQDEALPQRCPLVRIFSQQREVLQTEAQTPNDGILRNQQPCH